jgi:DNA-binding NarL/FixJ family response regulator
VEACALMALEKGHPGTVVSVFVCDDSPAQRILMGQLIEERPDLYLGGAASSAVGAVRAIEAAQTDVVLLDYLDHDGDVSVMVGAIRRAAPGVKILIHSGLPASRIVGVASADGYVRKDAEQEPLWQAIDELAQSRRSAD